MDAASIARPSRALAPDRDRLRPALELIAVVGLLELELWYLRSKVPGWQNVLLYGAIVAIILLSHDRRRREGLSSFDAVVGLGWAWVEALVAFAGLSALLVIGATFLGDSNETFEFLFLDKPPIRLANWLVGKFGAALAQQLALQMFLWPVCYELTRSRRAGTALAATIFGLIHLPSPLLVGITMLAGVIWICLYRRSGRLEPLVFCHMVLATLAHGSLPERLTYDMRVGITATADMKRFEELKDPRARLVNRRLKENRAELRHFSSPAYYDAQGGNLTGFLRGLYRDILGRPASQEDLAYWLGRKLENPRDDIPTYFLGSDEYAQIKQSRRAAAATSGVRR
jgi:membrane protease YdiL (CAAX protease family)